ncbi:MAG: outer membrane protein assembly factor BamD [Candidatus Omnitrophica bacterium]|nr:outer membrane protein assembly factor BamD [Candidatus Omnitrophota bacterium]
MQIKRFVFLLVVVAVSFIPTGRAHWIWSPPESPSEVSEAKEKQREVAKKIGDEFVSEKLQAAQPEANPSFLKSSVGGMLGAVETTKEFLERILFLRKKTPKQETSSPQPASQPYWVWSPAEGRFLSPQTAELAQKSAEEQYQYALKLRESGKVEEAVQTLRRVVHQYPQSAYAPEAQFLVATFFEERDKPLRASREFQKLIHEFPRSERIDQAVEHLFEIGNQFLAGEKEKVMGVAIIPVLSKAADIFRFIIEHSPYGPYGDRAQLALGIAFRRMGNFEEAVKTFETLIENYPTSSLVDEAHYQLAETSYEFSQNSNRDQTALSQASTHLKEFIQQYQTNTLAERARVLKQQLDEQDAEKNYRIGFYYEKQGFIESAFIYYEDVASRYSETAFGKKAAERIGTLNQPALAKQKGEAEIVRRMAEVRSMFEALDEESKRKGTDAQGIQDTAPLRSQLQAELATLTLAQKRLHEETEEKFRTRKQALRNREKNLKEKFKAFAKRKKSFRDSPSPELEAVFQKWEASLKKEQDELIQERQTIRSLRFELKPEKSPWLDWIPFVGKPQAPSREKLIQYDDKEWVKLERERAKIQEMRKMRETELTDVVRQIAELDAQEFEVAQKTPLFEGLLPVELKESEKSIAQQRSQLDESLQAFENLKKEYQSQYGDAFIKTLVLESGRKNLELVEGLIATGADLEETLKKLQTEKAALSLSWIAQQEKLNTLGKAFGAAESQLDLPQEMSGSEDEERAARILKKRIKFLEREIRSRVDQIEDWQRENAKRTDQLEALLRPQGGSFELSRGAKKVFSPATGAYKLGKAFLFGLPNHDREILEEAKSKAAGGEDFAPEELKAVNELKEEIELQSILIQGRAKEIEEMQGRLAELIKQAKQIPNFSYQSMLIERFPYSLDYSLTQARELLGGEDQEAIVQARLNREKQEFERLEKALSEINQKIETVGAAIERTRIQEAPAPVVIPSIPGGPETLPSASESSAQENEHKTELESKLTQMRSEIMEREKRYQGEKEAFHQALLHWYQTEAREKILPSFPADGKLILDQKEDLSKRRRDLEDALRRLVEVEHRIVSSQKKLLDQKLAEFEKRASHLKAPDSLQNVLGEEIKNTTQLRDSLVQEISFLENYPKK